jgi:hypothetical protein
MTNGIEASQTGIDLSRATDAQKVIDSRWRYFDIAYEKIISLGTVLTNRTIELFTHGLGFVPAFDLYIIDIDTYMTGDTAGGARADSNRVFLTGSYNNPGLSNTKVLLRVYNIRILEEYSAPIQQTLPAKTSKPDRFGIKITSATRAMRQPELSKFTVNTQGKAMAIQKHGTVVANSGTNNLAVITHNVGYPPTYLAAIADPKYQYVTPINPSFVPVIATANNTTLTFSGAQSVLIGTYAYIIFKELADFAI